MKVVEKRRLTVGKGGGRGGFLQVHPDLSLVHLGVVDIHEGLLKEEVTDEGDGSGLARVTGVGLESET